MIEEQKSHSLYSYLKNLRQFILGYISAYTASLIIAPAQHQRLNDFVRNHPHPNNTNFRGFIDFYPRMIAVQGWRSLWSGSLKNTNKFSIWQGLSFAFQDLINNKINNDQQYLAMMTNFQRYFLSGLVSGMLCCSIFYPFDITNSTIIRLNKSRKINEQFVSFEESVKNISQKQGFAGFYRNFSLALIETGVHRGLYFGIYYNLKSQQDEGFLLKFGHGWISGFASCIASYPFHAIRAAMWFAQDTPYQFKSKFHCFKKIVKERGIQGLYKGFSTRFGFGVRQGLIISFNDILVSFMSQKHP